MAAAGALALVAAVRHIGVTLRLTGVATALGSASCCVQIKGAAMKEGGMPPPEKIVKEFPRQGDLQLFRLEKLHEFQCIRCQSVKKSKLVAVREATGPSCSATAAMGCCNRRNNDVVGECRVKRNLATVRRGTTMSKFLLNNKLSRKATLRTWRLPGL